MLGIGTISPAAKLHVLDGSLLVNGDIGGTPASGSGRRLMWIPARVAFRAGGVDGSQWDDANIGPYSTAMGYNTTATGGYSTAMGQNTRARGQSSTAMGDNTSASGDYSTAIGYNVGTDKLGSFIIGDHSTGALTTVNKDNEFMAVFNGGFTLFTTRSWNQGVYMNGNTSGWTNISDRNKKENFRSIDGEGLLSKIRAMSITEWNYRQSDPSIRYIGPVAQDFYAAFHLGGTDSLGINSICIDGVNMAAIQALEKRTTELRERTAELDVVKIELAALKSRLARLEQVILLSKDMTERVSDESQR
jgi:trimeric autotransporter adhesin